TSVSGGSYALHDPSVLQFTAKVSPTSTPQEVRDILIKELEDFASHPATAEEVTRAKRKLKAQRERSLADSSEIGIELSEWMGAGDWRLLFLHRDRIAKVTPKDVNRVAKAYLLRSNRTLGTYVPTQQVARAPIPPAPDIEEVMRNYKGRKALAEGEK